MPSPVFSAGTFSPNKKEEEEFMNRYQKILKVSREKYSVQRKFVEEKIKKNLYRRNSQILARKTHSCR